MKRLFIIVKGIVQGVGFRPFIYNAALKYNLTGWVNNNSEGVYIDVEGCSDDINNFLNELKFNAPPLSKIDQIITEERPIQNYTFFSIEESERKENSITLISPDIATCKDCLEDIDDIDGRRYQYPFTNCTNCGPRFSIIKAIPYDRDKTTMKKFTMCKECNTEYKDPRDRRFHAQPNACDSCGPHLYIMDNFNNIIDISHKAENNSQYTKISWTADKLKEGYIWAIKGLTGFHLCCNAKNDEAVELLRQRKQRPHKPFAVMMRDITTVKEYCHVSAEEETLLTGIRKPIVLLKLKETVNGEKSLSPSLAPGQNTLGVMLPYTPLHHLLFKAGVEVLIMTSANIHGLPLEYKNEEAYNHLKGIADYFLFHDRDIHIPVDDSVARVVSGKERLIRRARGYAPEPMVYEETLPILACGSNIKNTFCISKNNFLLLSQHNGDLENLETYNHYVNNIEHFKNIFLFKPEYIAADLHPEYYSTKYAQSTDLKMVQVQHHHAHIVSCLAENKVTDTVIGVAFDGTGYGTDGSIWGGEFLICDLKSFTRAGHLKQVSMPGGDKAILEPWRMAVSYLYEYSDLAPDEMANYFVPESCEIGQGKTLLKTLEKNINCVSTSSMGRFFDAVSAILKQCTKISYEGQASMELEALIPQHSVKDLYPYDIEASDTIIFNPKKIINGILLDIENKVSSTIISVKFHNSIINATIEICDKIRDRFNINAVALSGGVFQNAYLLENVIHGLEAGGFTVYSHSLIPSNDGGVSLGQLIAANELIKGGL
ncbi:carbamoyltransferase HypF [Clostridium thermarum]|uniref:carbamoyltransferase HypF n=1 Tax=Clostridium thermarum TaxID=1716543 RepID=UPI0013D79AE7|nr:carbamoyltransferase HypF [Clostridium thermarum]